METLSILGRLLKELGQKFRNFQLVLVFLCLVNLNFDANATLVHKNTFQKSSIGIINALHLGESGLWLGGEKGIFFLQGNNVKGYSDWTFTFDYEVTDIFEDQNRGVWIASVDGGLHKFDLRSGKISQILGDEQNLDCWDLAVYQNKKLLVGCGYEVYLIHLETGEVASLLKDVSPMLFEGITKLAIDGKDNIWFSTFDNQIFVYKEKIATVLEFSTEFFDGKENEITDLFGDNLGNIWLANRQGVLKVNTGSLEVTNFAFEQRTGKSFIATIYQDNSDKIWLAGNTLYELDLPSEQIVISDVLFPTWLNWEKAFVNDITGGSRGELFLAANLYGLVELPASASLLSFFTDGDGVPQKNIAYSFNYSGQIIFSDGTDLYSYDLSTRTSTKLISDLGYIHKSLMLDKRRALISVDTKGLMLLDLVDLTYGPVQTKELGLPDTVLSEVYALEMDSEGRIFIGYFGDNLKGIYFGNLESGFIPYSEELYVDEMIRSSDGDIFVSTRKNGVLHFKSEQDVRKWRAEGFEYELITNCMEEGLDGTIWICTNGNGLAYLDRDSEKIRFIEKQFTNNSLLIRDLVADTQGFLWLMTGDGLIRFDPETSGSISLGAEDGIYDIDFEITASLKLNDSNILVSGDHYNYILDTEKVNSYLDERAKLTTDVVMTNMEISIRQKRTKTNGYGRLVQSLTQQKPLELNYEEYLFTFKFAANNYIERKMLGFEYRLLGLSDDWAKVKPEEASATYSTLPHGSYEFQVRVTDPKSLAEQPVLSIPILVSPPYWLTWQAYTLYFLILTASIWVAYKLRTRSLKKRNLLLASEVKERTEQLETSHKTVGKLLEQKEQFFENLSHEFKTPITLILGPLAKLKCESNSQDTSTAIDVIERSTQRLAYLVEQVLDLSKSNNLGRTEKTTYFVSQSLELMIQAFRPLIDSKNQQLEIDNASTIKLDLYADSFERIVTNLLSNAIKYSPKGGKVTIRSYNNQSEYILQVKDNGAGITENQTNSVFERFTRLDCASDETGTGLGLAVTKDIVEANNGNIRIESKDGEGATFTVTFPLGKQGSIREDDASATLDKEESCELPKKGEKKAILIVEDNADMANHIYDCLSSEFDCDMAEDGIVGVEKATNQVPDMIITDLMMPNKTGLELVEAIREDEITCHIPIIVLTARGDIESRMRGWDNNVDDYVAKPFAAEELVARTKRLFAIRELVRKSLASEVLEEQESESQIDKYSFKSAKDRVFFERFTETIKQGFADESFNRGKAAASMAMSERQLNRKLSALLDCNFSEFLKKYRLGRAKVLLISGHQITNVSYDVGFSSPSYFSSCFKAEFGMSPKAYVESEVDA